jgi:hypothetical protein
MNTYTITIKTLCGEVTTKTIMAESPKEALNQIIKPKGNAKIKKKSIR